MLLSADQYDQLRAPGTCIGVGHLISLAYAQAAAKQSGLHTTWISASARIGSKLPRSLLTMSVQSLGQLDMVLRCMEEEALVNVGAQVDPFGFQHQLRMSVQWVTDAYEIVRLLDERQIWSQSKEFESLSSDLRLLQASLVKHEIAVDAKQRESGVPIELKPIPSREDDTTEEYSHSDPKRAFIMPISISQRGSAMWMAVDVSTNDSRWIERLQLSERLLALWSS